jgi:hypothetical protein
MFTTTLAVALAGFMASTMLESPSWHAEYDPAQQAAKKAHKPLAVFVASGKSGWNLISREGELSKDVLQLLAKNYICVYVDTDLKEGNQLAAEFEIPNGLGLVVSDHAGKYQAFHHRGDLSSEQLAGYLRRYANPERIVRATETNTAERVSYYPLESDLSPSYSQAVPYARGFSAGGSGRSC